MRTRILAVLLCITLLTCLPLAPPVRAAGMTPSQGPVGIEVTISGLTAGQSYLIKWDGADYKTETVLSGGNAYFTPCIRNSKAAFRAGRFVWSL